MGPEDTIAAISTPPGKGGIGIIRISGSGSFLIAERLFRPKGAGTPKPGHVSIGQVVDIESSSSIDTAVLTLFREPHSYTGEDIAEIACHGAPVVLAQVLELAIKLGARIAEPGEFTLRAFLNGRMDLSQAEAVRDLIDSQTAYQARLATRQMDGALSRRVAPVKDALVAAIVQLESSIEFVEDDISTDSRAALAEGLSGAAKTLRSLEAGFEFGRSVRQGFDLAIVGRPNVGKSSVFNRLIGQERAIVTEIPGTTRDALYENASIRGIPARLIDTAGIRETDDPIETIGIQRTREAAADADVSLIVFDGSAPLTAEDLALLGGGPDAGRVVVINKIDLPQHLDRAAIPQSIARMVTVSALTGDGFDSLVQVIFDMLGAGAAWEREDALITNTRQHRAILHTIRALDDAGSLLVSGALEEIVLLRLREALAALGEITGETMNDDILAEIFSTFCIGK